VKRCCRGGPTDTPDSNGTVRSRARCEGLVAKAKDMRIIEAGMASAKKP
jgi:hypothetical protein